jgi:hypothetical protein
MIGAGCEAYRVGHSTALTTRKRPHTEGTPTEPSTTQREVAVQKPVSDIRIGECETPAGAGHSDHMRHRASNDPNRTCLLCPMPAFKQFDYRRSCFPSALVVGKLVSCNQSIPKALWQDDVA